jgi:hypothetical protein
LAFPTVRYAACGHDRELEPGATQAADAVHRAGFQILTRDGGQRGAE